MGSDLLDELKMTVEGCGLLDQWSTIEAAARPAIALVPIALDMNNNAKAQSRLGGLPDVPAGFVWPVDEHGPLKFVAQINLQNLPRFDGSYLPERGLLSFFYNDQVWGFDPKDRDGFKVYYFDGDTAALSPAAVPVNKGKSGIFGMFTKKEELQLYKMCPLSGRVLLTLPVDGLGPGYGDALYDNYCSLTEHIGGHHRMFGYAEPVQNEMEYECELVTNGLYCGDATGYNDPRAESLKASSHHWRLLLQIDSDTDNSDMMWGDVGRLYFWIKEQDLKERRFDNCWMIMQCG